MEVFDYVFGIRFVFKTTIFEIIYTVAKYVTFWNEGTFVRTAPALRKRLRIRSVISVNYHYITVYAHLTLIRFKCYNIV